MASAQLFFPQRGWENSAESVHRFTMPTPVASDTQACPTAIATDLSQDDDYSPGEVRVFVDGGRVEACTVPLYCQRMFL